MPRRAWHILTLAAFLAPGAPLRAQPPQGDASEPPVTDLQTLTREAERSFPGVQAAQHAVQAARSRLSEAKISPYFQFQATTGFTVTPDAQGTPTFSPDTEVNLDNSWGPAFDVQVEGAVPLYTFGKLRAARDAARAGVEAAQAGRGQAMAELRFDVRRAYFALQMALDLQQMVSEGRPKLADAIERLEQRLAQDDPDVDMMDKWRLGTALAEVDARVSEAKQLEATARQALRILSGRRRVRVLPCPLEPVEYDPEPLRRYVEQARESRPERRMLEAALDARQAEVRRHRAGYLPDIALALSARYSTTPGITDQQNPFIQDSANRRALGAALVARWSLDLWGNVHRVRRAEAQLAEARAKADEASRGMRLEVTKAYEAFRDARRREQAWQRGEKDGRSWFVAAVQAHQVGTVEPKDLVDALKAYFTARFRHLQAILKHNEALAELERVAGERLVGRGDWEKDCRE